MMELIEQSQVALDEVIDVAGRAMVEALLRLSAEGMAGPPHPGKKGGGVGWHGREQGTVCLKERKLRVKRPRLRKKGTKEGGEVPVPAYEAMQADGKLGSRMLEILLRGVSTRQYAKVLPQMAETVGVSRSSVSREAVEASEAELRRLCERRWDQIELLVIYVDGVRFGDHQVLGAVGVDREGRKHVLGLAEGASENEVVARGLLEDLVRRGVKPDRKYLFVIDGSKALRAAIDTIFGAENRWGLSPSLARCLGSTNLIESPHSGVRLRTRRVCRWRDGKMVLRWAAAAFLITESNFRRIMGYRDLWMLEAALGRKTPSLEERAA